MIRIKWVCTFLPLSLFVFPSLSVSLSLSRPIIPSDDNKAPFWLQPRSALPVHTVIYLSCHSSRCCRFYVRPLSLNYSSSIWVMDRLNIIIRYPERSRNIILLACEKKVFNYCFYLHDCRINYSNNPYTMGFKLHSNGEPLFKAFSAKCPMDVFLCLVWVFPVCMYLKFRYNWNLVDRRKGKDGWNVPAPTEGHLW